MSDYDITLRVRVRAGSLFGAAEAGASIVHALMQMPDVFAAETTSAPDEIDDFSEDGVRSEFATELQRLSQSDEDADAGGGES